MSQEVGISRSTSDASIQLTGHNRRGKLRGAHRIGDSLNRQAVVDRLYLNSNAVSSRPHCRQCRGAGAGKWIENGVTNEAKHPDEGLHQFDGIRGRVRSSRGASYGNDLLEPFSMRLLVDYTQHAHGIGRTAVGPWLPLHKNKLDIVLDDGVGLVRLPQKGRAVLDLEGRVGDLVPDHGRQVVKPDLATMLHDGSVDRHYHVGTKGATRPAHVADDHHETTALHENTQALDPDLIKLL